MKTRLLSTCLGLIAAVLLLRLPTAQAKTTPSLLANPGIESYAEIAPKLRGALATVALAAPETRQRQIEILARAGFLQVTGNRLQTVVLAAPDRRDAAWAAAEALGGACTPRDSPGASRLTCLLPPGSLVPLARSHAVVRLEPPAAVAPDPQPPPATVPDAGRAALPPPSGDTSLSGSVVSEGLAVSQADKWIRAGITGANVKVGVIDSGFEYYAQRQAAGELPGGITVQNFVDNEGPTDMDGVTKHGAACAEIIYDMAPGSRLYFARVQEPADVAQALAWFIAQGVQVVSSSIGFHSKDPGDGTGMFPDLVALAEQGNIVWVTSAGNERRFHYDGPFDPLDIVWNTHPIVVHNFQPPLGWLNVYGESMDSPEMVEPITVLSATLRWSDWGAPTTDLDLYLAMWDPSLRGGQGDWIVVAESINAQTGQPGDTPVEDLVYVTSADATKYGYFVRSYDGAMPANIELFAPRETTGRLAAMVHPRSLNNMAQVRDVLATGSMRFDRTVPDDYSSQGPTNGPGGVRDGGFNKPDLCGYAGVSTASYGATAFTGTSAAAPHVAGAAALVREKYPTWSASQVRSYLYRRAIDVASPGIDAYCGYGRLNLGSPPAKALTGTHLLLLLR